MKTIILIILVLGLGFMLGRVDWLSQMKQIEIINTKTVVSLKDDFYKSCEVLDIREVGVRTYETRYNCGSKQLFMTTKVNTYMGMVK